MRARKANRPKQSSPAEVTRPAREVVYIEPVAVKPSTAAGMLDCGLTKIWNLRKAGLLETINVGEDARITVASIKRFAAARK